MDLAMESLDITEQDALELLRRVRDQRASRELSLRTPDPEITADIMGRVRATSQQEGFHFTCICNRGIVSKARTGNCPACGVAFDFELWGK